MTRPFFHRERVSDLDTFDHHAAKAMAQLQARLREGHPVDIADIILHFTFDDATSFLFNHDLHCLDAGLRYPHYVSNAFTEAFHAMQTACATRNRYGRHLPLTEFWANKLDGPVRRFLDPILREAGTKKQAADRKIPRANYLLNMNEQDHSILGDEIMNITAAGRDTVRTRSTSDTRC
jgi:hypothetical protein